MGTLAWQDAFVALPWALINGLLFAGAWKWSRRWQPRDDALVTFVNALLLSWGLILVAGFMLGTVGQLTGPAFLTAVGVLAVLAFWGAHRLGTSPPFELSPSREWRLNWSIVTALAIGHVVLRGLLNHPAGWDTLGYHLPLVDAWLQAKSLYAPDFSHWSIPGNNELLGLWFVSPFSGDFWIGLTNLPAALVLAVASYEFARAIGTDEIMAHLAALMVVGSGVVWGQLITLDNDLAVAALFVASLNYGLRYAREGRAADLAYGAIASGILAGVKYYAIGYATVAGFSAIAFAWSYQGRRRILPIITAYLFAGIALAGYWYVRNAVATGNPLYPMPLFGAPPAPAGTPVGGGWSSTFLGSGRWEVVPLGIRALFLVAGPCALAAFFLFPAACASLLIARPADAASSAKNARGFHLALVLVAMASVAVMLVTPFAIEARPGTLDQLLWEPRTPARYGLCSESLAILLGVLALTSFKRWPAARVLSVAAAVGLVVAQYGFVLTNPERGLSTEVSRGLQVAFPDTYLIAFDVLIILGVARAIGLRLRSPGLLRRMTAWGCGLGLLVAGAGATGALSQKWHEGFVEAYDTLLHDKAIAWAERHALAGTKICVLDARPYPFFGSRRQFRVCQPETIHSADALFAFLKEHAVSILVTRSDKSPLAETVADHGLAAKVVESRRQSLTKLWGGPAFILSDVTSLRTIPDDAIPETDNRQGVADGAAGREGRVSGTAPLR